MVAGVLREYRIVYEELSYDNEPIQRHTLTLPIDRLFVNLTSLKMYRNYTFELQGISKFFGVRSPPIVIITDQDGKKNTLLYIALNDTWVWGEYSTVIRYTELNAKLERCCKVF